LGIVSRSAQLSGISRHFTIGRLRPTPTIASKTLSSAAESEPPGWMIGFTSSIRSP